MQRRPKWGRLSTPEVYGMLAALISAAARARAAAATAAIAPCLSLRPFRIFAWHLGLTFLLPLRAASANMAVHILCRSTSVFLQLPPFSPPPPLGRTRTLCPSLFLPLHTVCTNATGTTVSELLRSLTAVLKTSAAATNGEASDGEGQNADGAVVEGHVQGGNASSEARRSDRADGGADELMTAFGSLDSETDSAVAKVLVPAV